MSMSDYSFLFLLAEVNLSLFVLVIRLRWVTLIAISTT